jgi:hypothetical protein
VGEQQRQEATEGAQLRSALAVVPPVRDGPHGRRPDGGVLHDAARQGSGIGRGNSRRNQEGRGRSKFFSRRIADITEFQQHVKQWTSAWRKANPNAKIVFPDKQPSWEFNGNEYMAFDAFVIKFTTGVQPTYEEMVTRDLEWDAEIGAMQAVWDWVLAGK